MRDDAPFYLAINHRAKNLDTQKWYKAAPLGKNKLGKLLKDIATEGNLKGKFTNHSVRKTGITNLLHAGVPPTLITQVSGHKNVESIKNYAYASAKQQKAMANILANPGKVVSPITQNATFVPSFGNDPLPLTGEMPKENASLTVNTSSASSISGLFSGANLSGCTFNINILTANN